MYKVLIVDDEILIRVGIKSCINWEEIGFEVIGIAKNGKEALPYLDEVDVLITDILMPELNGIELIRKAKEVNKKIKIICLSCHNEYEYIREALLLGVEDYILKLSMKPKDLRKLMIKILSDIEDGKTKKRVVDNLQNYSEEQFRNYLFGIISYESFEKNLINRGLPTKGPCNLIYMTISNYKDLKEKGKIRNKSLVKFSFINIIVEVLKLALYVVEISEGEYLIIILGENNINLKEKLEKLEISIERYMKIKCKYLYSDTFSYFKEIKENYFLLKKQIGILFYYNVAVVKYLPNKNLIDSIIVVDNILIADLHKAIKKLDYTSVANHILNLYDNLVIRKEYEPIHVKNMFVELVYSFFDLIRKHSLSIESIKKRQKLPYTDIINFEEISAVKESVLEFLHYVIVSLRELNLSIEREEITLAKEYILKNINLDLSLDDMAKYCNISKSYFSVIFKKETGEYFNEYVNRIKIEKAYELITMYGYKIYEACAEVGFIDTSYFSKIFKKYIGVSPSKLKKPLKGK
ncbi:MAG: response regulator [Lachnospirales bacterium]